MFFILSKILWPLLQPMYHIAFSLFVAVIAIFGKWQKLAKWAVLYSFSMLILFGYLPLGHNMMVYLEKQYKRTAMNEKTPPYGILVLGGALDEALTTQHGQVSSNAAMERMTSFLSLARRFEKAKTELVFSGGIARFDKQGHNGAYLTEAEAAALFFLEQDFPVERIIFEGNARTTYENATYAKELLKPNNRQRWILVTSAYHMPRAMNVFEKQDWNIESYPVDFRTDLKYRLMPEFNLMKNLELTQIAFHEWAGNAMYYLTGKSASFLP